MCACSKGGACKRSGSPAAEAGKSGQAGDKHCKATLQHRAEGQAWHSRSAGGVKAGHGARLEFGARRLAAGRGLQGAAALCRCEPW